jgi:long-chain fatty acid transport protein
MKHPYSFRRALAPVVVGALAAWPAPLLASGFQLVEQNASGLGNAYAGQAAGVQDASAVFFNPARLARLSGKQVVVAVSPVGIATTFDDTASTRPQLGPVSIPVPLGSTGGDAGGWVPVPNAYFSWQVGSQWWLGLGVNAPFGLKTEWDADWVGRFTAVSSEVQTININPTVAIKLGDAFSIGGGANYQRLKATLSQGVPYGGLAFGGAMATAGPAAAAGILAQLGGPTGLTLEGLSEVEGDTWSWGWNVGAALEIGDSGSLAATYRSAIKHELDGTVTFAGAPTFATAGPLGGLGTALNGRFANGPVTAEIELPETVSVAAAYEGETVELLADWTWTGWSSIQALTIERSSGAVLSEVPLNFEDTWRAGLGLNYKLQGAWTLRLGTAYDTTPVQDAHRTPRLPDQDRIWAAIGFQYRLGKAGAFDVGYAHLFIDEGMSMLPNQTTPTSPPTGNLVGHYHAKVDIVSVQYRHSF